jgi:hypothetical protein
MRISIMRVASRPVAILVLAVGLLLCAAGRAEAGALNPLDFASLGAFPTATGQFTINTSGTPTLTEPNGTTLTGVVFNGIAVFDFDSINVLGSPGPPIPPAQSFIATGSLPLALLSRTDAMIAGVINGSGQGTATGGPPVVPGGPGGGNGFIFPGTPGGGPGGGGAGQLVTGIGASGGGGGGFGGPGGAGVGLLSLPGGPGGAPYGDLARQLQGGSGGGASSGLSGGGGGAIEIGAVGSLTVSGNVIANGGTPLEASVDGGGGGGGSGGGIFLHADSVLLTGTLSAVGGDGLGAGRIPGPAGYFIAAGGGGGGGEVAILSGTGGFTESSGATIDVAGGAGGVGFEGSSPGSPGGAGFINIVPEPASLVLMATGLLGLLGYTRLRHARAAA